MKKKVLIIEVIVGFLLVTLAAVAWAQDIEILEIKYREVERSKRYVTIAWLVKLQNNTNTTKEILVSVEFIDKDGFELEDDNESAILKPGTITTVTDTTMIAVDIYPQIKDIRVSF